MSSVDRGPICIVHIGENGDIDYLLNGEAVMFLVVDERAPLDRVYQITKQTPLETIAALLGDSPIGSRHDPRHADVVRAIDRTLRSKGH
jgi:hypothetical protein